MGKSRFYILILSLLILANTARAQAPAAAPSTAAPMATAPDSASAVATDAGAVQQGVVSAPKPVVLSFVEWKSLRVHEAQQKLEHAASSQVAGQSAPIEKFVGSDKATEQKLNFNVDVALQLNIQDYFSMYLKNLSKEEFKEATKKLNTEEATDLLLAYKASQESPKSPTLKFSKSEKR
ncbi:MAG: hypothetical protein IT287_07675 [Bdellovibrionaceae bacterium]|nr:hypothetical protein [Pseudobdellovibrionaceae bacterium]